MLLLFLKVMVLHLFSGHLVNMMYAVCCMIETVVTLLYSVSLNLATYRQLVQSNLDY